MMVHCCALWVIAVYMGLTIFNYGLCFIYMVLWMHLIYYICDAIKQIVNELNA